MSEIAQRSAPGFVRENFNRVFQIKIAVTGIEMPLWRRVQVPETSTFWELYVVVNNVLRWEFRSSITNFKLIDPQQGAPVTLELDSIWQERVDRYLSLKHPTCFMVIGKWLIVVHLEEVLDASPETIYPRALNGEGSAPDSDWIGPVFFAEILAGIDPDVRRKAVFDRDEVVFDDPDDVWIYTYCEEPVMGDAVDDLLEGQHSPAASDGRYPIKFPGRSRDLFLKHQLAPPELLAGTEQDAVIPGFVTLALTQQDVASIVDAIELKISGSEDRRLHQQLLRVVWYLAYFSDHLPGEAIST